MLRKYFFYVTVYFILLCLLCLFMFLCVCIVFFLKIVFYVFLWFLRSWGCSWKLCWRYVGPAGRHLGATLRQDDAQECQDKPRWRTRAPRRGKIAELRRWELSKGGASLAASRPRDPAHPPKNGFSRMGLRTPTPTGTGSGKLENWKTGKLED